MPRRRLTPLALVLLLAPLALGCRSAPEQVYQVSVANESDAPVVLWIAKEGDPFEPHWATPSEWQAGIAAGALPSDAPSLGVELPPNKRVELGPQRGRFARGARAVLYVYATPVTLAEMAATPRRSTLRDNVRLMPGQNFVKVRSAAPVEADLVTSLAPAPSPAQPPAAGGTR